MLEPALEALIAPLRSLLAAHLAPQESAWISINMTDSGADMLLEAEMRQGRTCSWIWRNCRDP